MSWQATFTNPEENYAGTGTSAVVPVERFGIQCEFGSVSVCQIFIRTEDVLSLYTDEDNSANPIQMNSTVTLERVGVETYFRGYIVQKPTMRQFPDGAWLEITCLDPTGVLMQSVCPYGGSFLWTLISAIYAGTAVGLQASTSWASQFPAGDTLWPDPTTDPDYWIEDASSPAATLNANIAAGATDIVLAAGTGADFAATGGWVKLSDGVQPDEWVYYPSCRFNSVANRYQLGNTANGFPCVRGELGTAGRAWTAAAPVTDVYNKPAKNIAPANLILYRAGVVQNYPADYGWDSVLGCISLLGSAGGAAYTIDYSVYDADGTLDGVAGGTVQDVIERMLEADNTLGGAGFAAGDHAIGGLPLAINRYEYNALEDEPYALPCIYNLMRTLGLEGEYEFWFDHRANLIRFNLPTIGLSTLTLEHVERIESEMDIEDVYSGVLLEYESSTPQNLIHHDRAWHQAAAGAGVSPDDYNGYTGGVNYNKAPTATYNAAGTGSAAGLHLCTNGSQDSALAVDFTHNPAGPVEHMRCWFPGGTMHHIERIEIVVNSWRVIRGWNRTRVNPRGDNMWEFYIEGSEDFDYTAPAGAYTWKQIGPRGYGEAATGGPLVPFSFADDTIVLKDVKAVRVMFDYMAGRKADGDYYYGYVADFKVYGKGSSNAVLVQTTDDPNDEGVPEYLYAPLSHRKLRGGIKSALAEGAPRVKKLEVGPGTQAGVMELGRRWLLLHLQLYEERSYQYEGVLPQKPELGDVAEVNELSGGGYEYTGSIRGYSIGVSDGECATVLRVLDYNAGLIE